MEQFYSPPRVAKILQTDPHKVLDWINSGELKAVNLSDRTRPRWKISPDDLQRFLDSRSNQCENVKKRKRKKSV
jgi:hypothetical protein